MTDKENEKTEVEVPQDKVAFNELLRKFKIGLKGDFYETNKPEITPYQVDLFKAVLMALGAAIFMWLILNGVAIGYGWASKVSIPVAETAPRNPKGTEAQLPPSLPSLVVVAVLGAFPMA